MGFPMDIIKKLRI